jgi:Putative addiction module component
MISDAAADVDRLTDLALALPPAARELVAYRIWESLQPDESWPLSREQVEEIERRADQTESAQTVDGDEVLRNARARIEARRR